MIEEKVQEATVSRGVRRYRALIFQGYVVAAAVVFIVLAILARFIPYFPIDLTITRTIQQINSPAFALLMGWLSDLGRGMTWALLVFLLCGVLAIAGLRWEAICALVAEVMGAIAGPIVKVLVNRPRPGADIVHVINHLGDHSFPSGHVLQYTAFFGFLWFISYTVIAHSRARTMLLFLFGSIIILIAPSRIYVGEHWASDTFGGYLLGSLCLALAIYIYRHFRPQRIKASLPAEKG